MSAINPTPQESFSRVGSNKPKPDAVIVPALLAGPRNARYRGSGARQPAQDGLILRQGGYLILEATFDPLSGRWLLVLPPSGAPSPPGSRSARLVGFQPTAHFGS